MTTADHLAIVRAALDVARKAPRNPTPMGRWADDEQAADDRATAALLNATGAIAAVCDELERRRSLDRPAPSTAQPPPVLDLDALAEAERAMTAGPWSMRRESHFIQIRASDLEELLTTEQAKGGDVCNAAGIVALRNAAPHLIAEARAAVALRAELAEVAVKLREAKRLGLEACSIAIEAYGPADDECPARATRAALEAL